MLNQGSAVLNFADQDGIDYGNNFDGTRFLAPRTGKYFLAMSGSASGQSGLVLTPSNVSPAVGLVRESDNSASNVFLSRDAIVLVQANNEVTVSASSFNDLSSADPLLNSIAMFNIDDVLMNPDYFFAGSTNTVSGSGYVQFTNTFSSSVRWSNNRYMCDHDGPVFVFASVGVAASEGISVVISRDTGNGVTENFYVIYEDTHHNGNDMASRAALINCRTGNELALVFHGASNAYSDSAIRTSFGGFNYIPKYGNPVAWALYRRAPFNLNSNTFDVVLFDEVHYVTNDMYVNTGEVIISVSGYYLIHISVGLKPREGVNVVLYNNNPILDHSIASISSPGAQHNDYTVLSRSIITRVQAGSRLVIRSYSDLYSFRDQYETSFSGMLLMPN